MKQIKVKIKSEGFVVGRNGVFDIQGLQIWRGSDDMLFFDFISKKTGKVLNAGGSITSEAMDELAFTWLKARGKMK